VVIGALTVWYVSPFLLSFRHFLISHEGISLTTPTSASLTLSLSQHTLSSLCHKQATRLQSCTNLNYRQEYLRSDRQTASAEYVWICGCGMLVSAEISVGQVRRLGTSMPLTFLPYPRKSSLTQTPTGLQETSRTNKTNPRCYTHAIKTSIRSGSCLVGGTS
jgi:hypothetical protein